MVLGILIIVLTFFSSINSNNFQDLNIENEPSPKSSAIHQIVGNSELAAAAATMGGGSGTLNDPYVLYYDPINASLNECGLLIQNTTKFAILNNTEIFGADLGMGYNITNLNLSSVENFKINNCSFHHSELDGIFMENVSNIIISNSNCSYNGRMEESWITGEGSGISITNSDFINISNSHFSTNFFSGIELKNVNNSIFTGNNMTENKAMSEMSTGTGLYASESNYITVFDNNLSSNWMRGIYGKNIENSSFESNFISNNGLSYSYDFDGAPHAIFMKDSVFLDLKNNNVSKNLDDGIALENSNHSIIRENIVIDNDNSGIFNDDCLNLSIFENEIILNNVGIRCRYAVDTNIFNNTITNSSSSGISVSFTDLINIYENIIEYCDQGFDMQWCDYANISLNLLNYCGGLNDWKSSFYLSSADNNIFTWNIVNNTDGYDFYISNSELNSIYGNFLYNISYDANQDLNNWNFTDYGNYWNNYSVYYPGAIATNGIYDTPYDRIYNGTSSFGNASDYLPLTFDYWQEIYDEALNPSPSLILQTPVLQALESTDSDGNITLNWDSIENATGYNIYSSSTFITNIDRLSIFDTAPNFSYNISGLSNGTYFYVVTAYNNSVESNASNCVWTEVRILPQNFTPLTPIIDPINATDDDGNFLLSWFAVEGAVNYSIYYSSTNPQSSGKMTNKNTPISSVEGMNLLDTVETTYYNVTGLSNGTYYFVIVANNASGSSEPSDIISVTVQIPPEEEPNPFFTPIIVLGGFIGTALGAVASNFIPSDKIVEFLKETRDKLGKKTKSDVKSDRKGDVNKEADGDLQKSEEPITLEETVPISTQINWQRVVTILDKLWNYLPKNLRDMLLNVVDKYLKFRDEAELIILNSFYSLSLGYLTSFSLYRTGDTNKCISTLDEISQEAHKAEFENLSEEAKITKEEFISPIEEINKEKEDLK
nr:hypothetical protein DSAG12_02701 [Candidatus Prometheoarchaeum syntrophicum]